MNDLGELAAPVIHDGVIYAINAKWTFAIDAETGRQIWRTPVQTEPGMTRAGSAIYRGAPAIYEGKLYRVTVDNHLVALEMKTGRVLWNKKFAEWKEGYHSSGSPMVANGARISGVAGTEGEVVGEMAVGGKVRKVMIQSNKNGFMYVLDRTNCKLIAAHPYTKVTWASGIDMATGRPQLTGIYKDFLAGGEVEIYPSRGANAVPLAFNPAKGLVYAAPWDLPRLQQLAPPKPQVIGESSTGVNARQPTINPGDVVGAFIAIDPLTGQRKWEAPLTDIPSSAGMLVTGGGLVFTGKLTGEFLAIDEDTGRTLWQFQTSSSINSTAITYTHKGRQYVTVASGLGGILARRAIGDKVPTGGSMWTFTLMTQ